MLEMKIGACLLNIQGKSRGEKLLFYRFKRILIFFLRKVFFKIIQYILTKTQNVKKNSRLEWPSRLNMLSLGQNIHSC